ncbi:MAG: Hpt domain-containing protein [Spirochaetales bacterium]
MALSEGVQSRLKALADLFASELPGRIAEVVAAVKAADNGYDPEAFAELRMRSHKLAGSAATFGFVTITATSRQIEHIVERALSEERPLEEQEGVEVRRLVEDLSAAHEPAPRSAEQDAEPVNRHARRSDGPRVLGFLSEETFELLEEYLGMLGITLDRKERLEDVRSGDSHSAVAVVVELPRDRSGVLTMAEIQSTGLGEGSMLYVLAPEDAAKLRLQVTRLAHARYIAAPYPLEGIAEEIHAAIDVSRGVRSVLVAGIPGGIRDRVAKTVEESNYSVVTIESIEALFSEVVFLQPEAVIFTGDLIDARRGDACRALGQDSTLPPTSILYVCDPSQPINEFEAFDAGARQIVPAQESQRMLAWLNQVQRDGRRGENKLFRWILTEVSRAQRLGRDLSLVLFEIDQLPQLRAGHAGLVAHRAVQTLSSLLSRRLRQSDSLLKNADLGFSAVLFDAGVSVATEVSKQIVSSFEQTISSRDHSFSLSIGIAGFPEFDGPLALLEAASRARERARATGGSRVEVERKS